jgi:hypothetical protein
MVRVNTGVGFAPAVEWANSNNWGGSVWKGFDYDFNGDGKPDFWYVTANTSQVMVRVNTGVGFAPAVEWANNNNWGGADWKGFSDFNGDGKPDFWYVTANTSQVMVRLSGLVYPDLLISTTTGLNATTSLTYKPLTDTTVYTKDTNAVYPYVDVQAPIYVVSSVSTSNGIGGNYVTNYNYAGAKSHLTGGGFLGFREKTTTDAQGIKTISTSRQDYPYQGLPLTVQKKTATGTLLNSVTNTWAFDTNAAWGSTYHVPKLAQSVEASYELNGSPITTVTTSNQYDTWGNPTQITVNTNDGYSKTTVNQYWNDPLNWFLGRLTKATVTSTTP